MAELLFKKEVYQIVAAGVPIICGNRPSLTPSPCTQGEGWGGGSSVVPQNIATPVAAAIEVHRELGAGFAEAVYPEALQIELAVRGIPFEAMKPLQIFYKGRLPQKSYVTDLICQNSIIIELKALDQLSGKEQGQLLNYLRATGFRVGLLLNFGNPAKLEWERYVR
jgi:GxxExxY protein